MTTEITPEQLAADKGISKRWAYALIRQQREADLDLVNIPNNQRERVLSILSRRPDETRNSRDLMVLLQGEGYAIDGHDTTKVLWSLQKTNHVKFREHQNPRYLYAIKLTTLGKQAAWDILHKRPSEVEAERAFQSSEHGDGLMAEPFVDQAVADADLDAVEGVHTAKPSEVESVVEVAAEIAEPEPAPEPIDLWFLDETSFPTTLALRERHRRAQKLTAAARLLEEEGEDEMALALIGKTEFTPLELEVLDILERYTKGEI